MTRVLRPRPTPLRMIEGFAVRLRHRFLPADDSKLTDEQIARIERRIRWLSRKIGRLPIGSNGRRRCVAELTALNALVDHDREQKHNRALGWGKEPPEEVAA